MRIYICGVPRVGKTTLAKYLKRKLKNTNLFVSEAFRNGFQAMRPSEAKDWGTKTSKLRTDDFPVFLKTFLEWNEKFSGNDSIVDLSLLNIEKIYEMLDENDIIVCLGFGGKSNNEIFKIIRKFEHGNDYTITKTDEELKKLWGDMAKRDKHNMSFAAEHNISYFETTEREKISKEIYKYIKSVLTKNNEFIDD